VAAQAMLLEQRPHVLVESAGPDRDWADDREQRHGQCRDSSRRRGSGHSGAPGPKECRAEGVVAGRSRASLLSKRRWLIQCAHFAIPHPGID
jgi:hypothetical protein